MTGNMKRLFSVAWNDFSLLIRYLKIIELFFLHLWRRLLSVYSGSFNLSFTKWNANENPCKSVKTNSNIIISWVNQHPVTIPQKSTVLVTRRSTHVNATGPATSKSHQRGSSASPVTSLGGRRGTTCSFKWHYRRRQINKEWHRVRYGVALN